MAGIFSILNIGAQALNANQRAIQITGHNIANVNTRWYSKQDPVFITSISLNVRPGPLGTGAEVGSIRQCKDMFLEMQIFQEAHAFGDMNVKKGYWKQIEELFNESNSGGLNSGINDFFNAWQDLANAPGGIAERNALRAEAEVLLDSFHRLDSNLRNIQTNADEAVAGSIADINFLTREIAELNEMIKTQILNDGTPNDLMDQRARAMRDLAEKVDYTFTSSENGTVNIMIGMGVPVVMDDVSYDLVAVRDGATGFNQVHLDVGSGSPVTVHGQIRGGELGAYITTANETVPDLLDKLNLLAYEMVDQINTIHFTGYNLNNTSELNFFEAIDPADLDSAASLISLSTDVEADAANIAASDAIDAEGNNLAALAILELQYATFANLGDESFNDYVGSTTAYVGSEARAANSNLEHQEAMMYELETMREEVSGVSLDEEMTKLIQYQRSFEAASRVINLVDEMIGVLVNLV